VRKHTENAAGIRFDKRMVDRTAVRRVGMIEGQFALIDDEAQRGAELVPSEIFD
jgi:hypothetical protein